MAKHGLSDHDLTTGPLCSWVYLLFPPKDTLKITVSKWSINGRVLEFCMLQVP